MGGEVSLQFKNQNGLMKTIIVITLSILTFLSSEVTFSKEKDLEIKFLKKSNKEKVKVDTLDGDSYLYLDGQDEYYFNSIEFVNWSSNHGLRVTKRLETEETEKLVLHIKNINGVYTKKKKTENDIFTLDLHMFNLTCCGEYRFQIIDSDSEEVVKDFKVGQYIYGE